ncbi:unnamed protein product, partial [Mesorhabditis belari]|uniref:Uncharacterized protein n=1 Tax=Mesorhabditis belari TaxID=2138241 RepID=A0AAF3ESZ0_9BILA
MQESILLNCKLHKLTPPRNVTPTETTGNLDELELRRRQNIIQIACGIFSNSCSSLSTNCILNIPQLLASYSLLTNVTDATISKQLNSSLFGANVVIPPTSTEMAKFLSEWCNQLMPNYSAARRLIVHSGAAKSYSFSTFLVLTDLFFGIKIWKEPDMNEWLKKQLEIESPENVFTLWTEPDPPKDKDKATMSQKLTVAGERATRPNTLRCPIITGASLLSVHIPGVNYQDYFQLYFEGTDEMVRAIEIKATKPDSISVTNYDRHKIYSVATMRPELTIYIFTEYIGDMFMLKGQVIEALRFINNNTRQFLPVTSLIMPIWDDPVKAAQVHGNPYNTNDLLFCIGAFDDLAHELSEPSTSNPPAIQHYDLFQISGVSPKACGNAFEVPNQVKGRCLITSPFMLVLMDRIRGIPIEMAYIAKPTPTTENKEVKERKKCTIS